MKKNLSSFVIIVVLLVSTLFSSNTTIAAADIEKPELLSISIDKTKAFAGDDINITAKVSEKGGSGVDTVIISYIMPITKKTEYVLLEKVNDSTFEGEINTTDRFEEGLWKLDSVLVSDDADNTEQYYDKQANLAVFKIGVRDFSHMFFDFKEKPESTNGNLPNITETHTTEKPTIEVPKVDNVTTEMPTVEMVTTEKPVVKPAIKVSKPVITNKFIADNTTVVKGIADTNATVYAVANNKFIGSVKATKGKFSMKIVPLKAGTKVSFYAYANKKKSSKVYFTIIDKTGPKLPSVNKVTAKSKVITGKGEAKAKVYVYNGKKLVGTSTVSTKKTFSVNIKAQKRNTNLSVYLVDNAGNKSKVKSIKVS